MVRPEIHDASIWTLACNPIATVNSPSGGLVGLVSDGEEQL